MIARKLTLLIRYSGHTHDVRRGGVRSGARSRFFGERPPPVLRRARCAALLNTSAIMLLLRRFSWPVSFGTINRQCRASYLVRKRKRRRCEGYDWAFLKRQGRRRKACLSVNQLFALPGSVSCRANLERMSAANRSSLHRRRSICAEFWPEWRK